MKHKDGQAYLFPTPFLILASIFYVIPAVLTIATSFIGPDLSFAWEFNNSENFQEIFLGPNTITIMRNTCIFVGVAVTVMAAPDPMSAILTIHFIRADRYSNTFKPIPMIPIVTSAMVYSTLWIWLLEVNEDGVINKICLTSKGLGPIDWVAKYLMQIVLLATIPTSIAYRTTVFSSAIKNVSDSQFKAAHVDGVGEWGIIKSIILPNIRHRTQSIVLWETLGPLANYVTTLLITSGRPGTKTEVWALLVYRRAFTDR